MTLKVAIDDGFAHTKLAWMDEKGRMKTFSIPSLAASGLQGVIGFDGKAIHAYETEDQKFTVGPLPNAESTAFAEYPFTPLNRTIIHHALVKAGLNDRDIEPGLTLPFDVFYRQPDIRERRIQALYKSTACISDDNMPLARLANARLYPEAAVAWIDAYIDDMGMPVRDTSTIGPVAVVDVGGRTTDIALFLGEGLIDQARSGTEVVGVLNILGIIEDRIAEMNGGIRISRSQAENALRTGKVHIFKEVDVSDVVREAKNTVAQNLYRVLQRRINRAFELEEILFIGGGAEILREALAGQPDFPQARIVADPQFANARGILKYMSFIEGQ